MNEMLNHGILTKDEELMYGRQVATARQLRLQIDALVREKRMENAMRRLEEEENDDNDDDNDKNSKEDIGIMDTYVAEGISTNESMHQQRKTALLAHAKLADKGIILETALQYSDMP